MSAPWPQAPHGTASRYGRGCRCVPCRKAKAEQGRRRYVGETAERKRQTSREWKERNRAWVRDYDRRYNSQRRGRPTAPYYHFLEETA